MTFKGFLKTRTFIILGLVVLIFLTVAEFRQWQNRRSIQREIDSIQKQASDLGQKNQQLSDSLSYLNTSDYKEKIARQQLNLKKQGEIVVNFPQNLNFSTDANKDNSNKSNAYKWWSYFFNK